MLDEQPAGQLTDLPRESAFAHVQLAPQKTTQRGLGAFYTPHSLADFMTQLVLERGPRRVLEPSFGDGVFLNALHRGASILGLDIEVLGSEIADEPVRHAVEHQLLAERNVRAGDFLSLEPEPVDAVIGNPPYVRLRHLPADQRKNALAVADRMLPSGMEPSGSVWMSFVLHACRFLREGGMLAFVLPYDITYVRYARPLWAYLASRFKDLRLIRLRERMFEDINQETVVLLADGFGGMTDIVRFTTAIGLRELGVENYETDAELPVESIVNGERIFLEALLKPELRALLTDKLNPALVATKELVTFNIGYVTGDKTFFHPTEDQVRRYRIPDSSLLPAVTSARAVRDAGLRVSGFAGDKLDRLFLPPENPTPGEWQYIETGVREGVHERYKCRIRSPWFRVPYVRPPQLLLSVFAERPLLLVNDVGVLASNSFLCGYTDEAQATDFAGKWYSSLTLLQCELEVHSLGGGVLILIPGEVGRIRVPVGEVGTEHLTRVDQLLREGRVHDAYRAGDSALSGVLGLDSDEIELIHEGVATLTSWRARSK